MVAVTVVDTAAVTVVTEVAEVIGAAEVIEQEMWATGGKSLQTFNTTSTNCFHVFTDKHCT